VKFKEFRKLSLLNDFKLSPCFQGAQAIFRDKPFQTQYPTFSKAVTLHAYSPMKMEQSVPKRRHLNYRLRGKTQKKAEETVDVTASSMRHYKQYHSHHHHHHHHYHHHSYRHYSGVVNKYKYTVKLEGA
jgi:hypothetical protein